MTQNKGTSSYDEEMLADSVAIKCNLLDLRVIRHRNEKKEGIFLPWETE